MRLDDLATTYSSKADEELLLLVGTPDQLTPEALGVLNSELSRRKISITRDSPPQPQVRSKRKEELREPAVYSTDVPRVAEFISEVLRIYHSHFALFTKLAFPAVALGYVVLMAARFEARAIISRDMFRGGLISMRTNLVELGLMNFSAYLVSWLASSASFAAICSVVDAIRKRQTPSSARPLSAVIARLGPLFRLSMVLFLVCVFLCGALTMAVGAIFTYSRRFEMHLSPLMIWIISYAAYSMVLLVLSRFALAIPAVILGDYGVRKSLFLSDELTQGKWLILAALLAKSLVGGYVAAMLPYWIREWIWSAVQLPVIAAQGASIAAVTTVEPVMFIGFALLYLRTKVDRSHLALSPLELAPQHLKEIGSRPV